LFLPFLGVGCVVTEGGEDGCEGWSCEAEAECAVSDKKLQS
jgi:hypothetical protein